MKKQLNKYLLSITYSTILSITYIKIKRPLELLFFSGHVVIDIEDN